MIFYRSGTPPSLPLGSGMAKLPSSENKASDNIFCVGEYSSEIYSFLKVCEHQVLPVWNYMERQRHITHQMRVQSFHTNRVSGRVLRRQVEPKTNFQLCISIGHSSETVCDPFCCLISVSPHNRRNFSLSVV